MGLSILSFQWASNGGHISCPDLHIFTLKFLALKKQVFSLFRGQKFLLKTFQKKLRFFFDPEKVNKQTSKVTHNRPNPFYFTIQPIPHTTDFSYYEILGPDICSLICDGGHC